MGLQMMSAEEFMYAALNLPLPGLQECRNLCNALWHNDDFVAVGRGCERLTRGENTSQVYAWARDAIESDGQGPAEVRLVYPVGRAITPFFSKEEIEQMANRLKLEAGLPLSAPHRVFRITYWRRRH